jgi:nitroreductase
MCRDYTTDALPVGAVDALLDLARRAPSAGFSQGFSFLVLEGAEQTARFWDRTLPVERRPGFPWPGLLNAPVLVLPLCHAQAYVDRYAEPDKARTGLGGSADAWPVPYWYVDTAMATQNLLLAAVDAGFGALFFGIFQHEQELMADLGVPAGHRPIGAVAIGHPAPGALAQAEGSAGRRPRRPLDEIVHRGRWQG